jgi:hypothetical protein
MAFSHAVIAKVIRAGMDDGTFSWQPKHPDCPSPAEYASGCAGSPGKN